MPLRDHFHPPLSELRHWESFHARWAAVLADTLEAELLPPGYFAEVQIHVGTREEIDIATFADEASPKDQAKNGGTNTLVTAQVYSPPVPTMVWPATFPDRLEILIMHSDAGPTLVAAIELVSPRNKDREASRRAFALKCANYLHGGVGLVVVDVVTNRHANLHNEMVRLLELDNKCLLDDQSLYAVSYRPVQQAADDEIQVWAEALAVGTALPVVPLPLDKGQCVPLDLEAAYELTCQRVRFPDS